MKNKNTPEDIFDTQCRMNHIIADPVEGAYRPQAAKYYMKDHAMNDYHAVKLEPLVKPEPKQKPSQPS